MVQLQQAVPGAQVVYCHRRDRQTDRVADRYPAIMYRFFQLDTPRQYTLLHVYPYF